jgi:prepilin-type N-terminal cleavage/methylation domain-containing protein
MFVSKANRFDKRLSSKNLLNSGAFSLIELLVVICVIGILSALIIASISNASRDSRWTVARQQQATLQTALNAWVASTISIASARRQYNKADAIGKLGILSNYFQPDTFADFSSNSTPTNIRSRILSQLNYSLTFTDWNLTNQPSVQLVTNGL